MRYYYKKVFDLSSVIFNYNQYGLTSNVKTFLDTADQSYVAYFIQGVNEVSNDLVKILSKKFYINDLFSLIEDKKMAPEVLETLLSAMGTEINTLMEGIESQNKISQADFLINYALDLFSTDSVFSLPKFDEKRKALVEQIQNILLELDISKEDLGRQNNDIFHNLCGFSRLPGASPKKITKIIYDLYNDNSMMMQLYYMNFSFFNDDYIKSLGNISEKKLMDKVFDGTILNKLIKNGVFDYLYCISSSFTIKESRCFNSSDCKDALKISGVEFSSIEAVYKRNAEIVPYDDLATWIDENYDQIEDLGYFQPFLESKCRSEMQKVADRQWNKNSYLLDLCLLCRYKCCPQILKDEMKEIVFNSDCILPIAEMAILLKGDDFKRFENKVFKLAENDKKFVCSNASYAVQILVNHPEANITRILTMLKDRYNNSSRDKAVPTLNYWNFSYVHKNHLMEVFHCIRDNGDFESLYSLYRKNIAVLKDEFYEIAKKRNCSQRFLDSITADWEGEISSECGDE